MEQRNNETMRPVLGLFKVFSPTACFYSWASLPFINQDFSIKQEKSAASTSIVSSIFSARLNPLRWIEQSSCQSILGLVSFQAQAINARSGGFLPFSYLLHSFTLMEKMWVNESPGEQYLNGRKLLFTKSDNKQSWRMDRSTCAKYIPSSEAFNQKKPSPELDREGV